MDRPGFSRGAGWVSRLPQQPLLCCLAFAAVALLRAFFCLQLPANTADLPRHIAFGASVGTLGLSAAKLSLMELNPALAKVSWPLVPYNYPIVTLAFFTGIAKISPTIFFAKLSLTLIEAVNAWLVFVLSRQRWLAFLYWLSPLSIWWVSHEGQFEPLQNLFVFGSLLALRKRGALACFLLALAIQVKLTAVLLVPLFAAIMFRNRLDTVLKGIASFLLGFAPTVLAMSWYPILDQMLSRGTLLTYNPYYWDVRFTGMFNWNPQWLIALNQAASYAILLSLVIFAIRGREVVGYLAPTLFVAISKASFLFQPWYFICLPSFLLPLHDQRKRFWLFAMLPFLDLWSALEIIVGPFGFTAQESYAGLSVFTRLIRM